MELLKCRSDPVYWFNSWVWTYNPKNVGTKTPAFLPMDLFPRQEELVAWFYERMAMKNDGLLEKSRDIGFTWVAGGVALHGWLFIPGFKATFGSRKAEYVDRIGDPDSIFEKIRMIRRSLPQWMLPMGFSDSQHDRYMLLENPHTNAIIRGESGDDMGRGGRSSIYLIDEAAFIERAEKVEAATSANTDVRIWGSSVNGNGNFFARKRFGGSLSEQQIFRFHYTDDPRKDAEWAKKEKARLEPHVWASEYDIDYSASVEGICIPGKWVDAAKKLAQLVRVEPDIRGIVGGDVGAGGKGKSVAVARYGAVVLPPRSWGHGDTIDTASDLIKYAEESALKDRRADKRQCKITTLYYDSVGVGKGVQDAMKRKNTPGMNKMGVNVGIAPSDRMWPDGEDSKHKFGNLKAEAWWIGRERFKCSYEKLLFIEGKEGGVDHPVDDCIFLPSDKEGADCTILAAQISMVKWHRDEKGKIMIQSKDSLRKDGIASPDHADALMLTFAGVSVVEEFMKALGAA